VNDLTEEIVHEEMTAKRKNLSFTLDQTNGRRIRMTLGRLDMTAKVVTASVDFGTATDRTSKDLFLVMNRLVSTQVGWIVGRE
jgi:hypothetical protein